MKTKIVKGTIESAYKKPVSPALNYSGETQIYVDVAEVKAANAWPNDKQVVKLVNRMEVAKKRAELIKATLDAAGYKAPTLEDDAEAIRATAKVLMARKKAATQAEAEAMAREILGIADDVTVDDEDEDETEDEPVN